MKLFERELLRLLAHLDNNVETLQMNIAAAIPPMITNADMETPDKIDLMERLEQLEAASRNKTIAINEYFDAMVTDER